MNMRQFLDKWGHLDRDLCGDENSWTVNSDGVTCVCHGDVFDASFDDFDKFLSDTYDPLKQRKIYCGVRAMEKK